MATLDGVIVAPSQTASGEYSHNSFWGDVETPAVEVTGTLVQGFAGGDECTAPAQECTGTLLPGCVLTGEVEAPAAEATGYINGPNTATAPAQTATGTLLPGSVLSGVARAPKATASGSLSSDNVMSGTAVAPSQSATGTLAQGQTISGTAVAPAARATGSASSGSTFSGAATAPAAEVVGTLAFGQILFGTAVAPAQTVGGPLSSSGVRQPATIINDVVEAFTGWLMNTEGGGLSNYTNFPFHTLVEFSGSYYGVADDGVYLLGGDTDNGDNIGALIEFGITDFDTDLMKRLGTVVFDMRASGSLKLHVTVDGEDTTLDYEVTPQRAGLHPVLVHTGRGLKSFNWQFAISNVQGADFDLHALDLGTKKLNRRAG